jgi:hypothetical protein
VNTIINLPCSIMHGEVLEWLSRYLLGARCVTSQKTVALDCAAVRPSKPAAVRILTRTFGYLIRFLTLTLN